MAVISVKGGNNQVILDGSQDTLSLLAITTGTGLIHVGDPAPEGFDVPFAGGDRIVLPANLSATLFADGFVVTGSIGQYGGQIYSGGGTPAPFWEPFTVTTAQLDGVVGYEAGTGGSITNEPIDGFTVTRAVNDGFGVFTLEITGPQPIASNAVKAALVGIDGETYSFYEVTSFSSEVDVWVTTLVASDVPEWTVGQQVPIVIIPQP